jgi:hypothetical protein
MADRPGIVNAGGITDVKQVVLHAVGIGGIRTSIC